MATESEMLAYALPREISRVRRIQDGYKAMRGTPGVNVEPGIAMMEQSIDRAIKAMAEHDTVAALAAYNDLSEYSE